MVNILNIILPATAIANFSLLSLLAFVLLYLISVITYKKLLPFN